MTSSDVVLDVPTTSPAPAATARRGSKGVPLIIGVILAALAVGYAGRAILHGRHHVTSDNAQLDGHITQVAPKVQAFVDRVLVEDNQRVKAGDTLVVLDARDLRLRL